MNLMEKRQKNTNLKRQKIIIKKLKKQVRGITLIALVVTIIVLLILAGVALSLTVGDNGLFRRAEQATNTWRNAETNEQLAMEEVSDWMDGYPNGDGEDNALKEITGNETENTITQDKLGNPITIPAGFKVVNPEDDVTKGIIIEDVSAPGKTSDTKGSQFVWIPVGDVYTSADHTEENKVTITLGRYTFDSTAGANYGKATLVQSAENYANETQLKTSSSSSYYYRELLKTTSSSNTKAKDIEDFVTKATTSGGYYIVRYEAGDATATSSARTGTNNVSNPNNPLTCKAGVYPYNYINQADASKLCQEMYSSSNFESDLINSYAWDTAIVFIQEFSGDTNYSQQRGRNTARAVQKCGESILDYNLDEGDEAQDKRCNIYDMAGNTREWSTETNSNTSYPCVTRGGYYSNTDNYTSRRFSYNTPYGGSISARPTLYL